MLSALCVYGTYIPLSQGSSKIADRRAMGRGTNLIQGWSRGTLNRTSIECVNLAVLIVSKAQGPQWYSPWTVLTNPLVRGKRRCRYPGLPCSFAYACDYLLSSQLTTSSK
jgi:hypothetical protein